MALAQNIKALREARGWSTYDLAGKIHRNQSIIARAEAGSRPRKVTFGLIARAFGISEQQLEYGDPSLDVGVNGSSSVPILTSEEAGLYMGVLPAQEKGKKREQLTAFGEFPSSSFAMRAHDRSMVPEIKAGDMLVIDPEYAPEPECYIVAADPDGQVYMGMYKSLGKVDGKAIWALHPLNDMFPDVRSDHARLRIVGRIRQVVRTF